MLPLDRSAAQATRASAAALAGRCVQAHQHSADLVAVARDLCHTGRILRALERTQRARRDREQVTAPAWSAMAGLLDGQVVRAVVDSGRLACDRLVEARASLLVDSAAVTSDDPPHRFRAQPPSPTGRGRMNPGPGL